MVKRLNKGDSTKGNTLVPAVADSTAFITVWKVAPRGVVKLFTHGSFTIDWGDGTVEKIENEIKVNEPNPYTELEHHYNNPSASGEYTVSISSSVTHFLLEEHTAKKLIKVTQWGSAQWGMMAEMFYNAENMICTATDKPDISRVLNLSYAFYHCYKFNSPIEEWDFSMARNLHGFLYLARSFNQSLTKMDLISVNNVTLMLEGTALVQDLRKLKIDPKVNTGDMFGVCSSLDDYNEQHAERYEAEDQQQKFKDILKK